MVEAGMIVYADHTSIISTISEVVINWEEEFVTLNTGKDKLDHLPENMPLLEDVSDLEPNIRMCERAGRIAQDAIETIQALLILALLLVDDAEAEQDLVRLIKI